VETFRELHQKLLRTRIRPYCVFHCEPAPGIDHFRTSEEKGAELIRDAIRDHTTGLAQPMYVVATNIDDVKQQRILKTAPHDTDNRSAAAAVPVITEFRQGHR
jgi:L-lysine 2,3-aminomutase